MFAAGLQPALGTDSLASSQSLDVLDEARALHRRLPELPAEALVRMATWNGARALGRTDLGRIVAGARPGILAFDLTVGPSDDVCEVILRDVAAPRRLVVRRTAEGAGADR